MGDGVRVFNQSFSCKAPMVMPVDLDFTNDEIFDVDLSADIDMGRIDFISSVIINLRSAAFNMILTPSGVGGGNFEVFARQGYITYCPILLTDVPKFRANISAPLNSTFQIMVSNIPFFPFEQNAI